MKASVLYVTVALALGYGQPGWSGESGGSDSGPADGAAFGSPDAVENILREDHLLDWKTRLQTERGLGIGLDYTTNLFGASDSLGEDGAWGGMVRCCSARMVFSNPAAPAAVSRGPICDFTEPRAH